ncbi:MULTISPECIES: serine hydrolase domain-containing protein [Citricoccus]|uniref:serine hydrolase domain-containing protein n=1 Tax=Citricoccus TaxID=169133 RepID=UPI000255F640|nr:serine hydrolase domain-containing protein [Citricoccus sp. CH26A]
MAGTADAAEPTARLEGFLQRLVEDGTVPGAVLVVSGAGTSWEGSTVVCAGSMAEDGPPMRPDALMRIQSMTKPLTAAATLLAVQEGELRLEDPVLRWLPELADRTVLRAHDAELSDVVPADREITVRDLLVNGCGYGMEMTDSPLARRMMDLGVSASPDQTVDVGADEWLRRLATLPLAHQPGEGFRYHHGFSVLGILLQRMAGVGLQDHLDRVLFSPLGMEDTSLWVPPEKASRLPAAFRRVDGKLRETEPLGGGFYVGEPAFDTAHGELVSTARDYLRFARMLADGGRHAGHRFLDAVLVAEMTRDQVAPQAKTPESMIPGFWDTTGWGYGISVETSGDHPGRLGWSGGQGTTFLIDPDGTIVVFLSQVEADERMGAVFQAVHGLAAGPGLPQ